MPDPNYIRIKRSNTATNVPSSLESGELAANVVDQKLWIGASNTTPVLISDILGTFTNKGSWDYYSTYQVNNVVEYSGVFYFAKSSVPPYNTQPNINTTYWSPFSNPSGGGITLNDISSTMTGLDYNNTTGVFSATSGYSIPQTSSQTNWDSAYTQRLQWDGGSTNLTAATGRTSLGLENVENTALSTWTGSTNLTTLGNATSKNLVITDSSTGVLSSSYNTLNISITGSKSTNLSSTTADVYFNLNRTITNITAGGLGPYYSQIGIRVTPPNYTGGDQGFSISKYPVTMQIDSAPTGITTPGIATSLSLYTGYAKGRALVIQGATNQYDGGSNLMEVYDSNYNLIFIIDPRGYTTVSGNLIVNAAVSQNMFYPAESGSIKLKGINSNLNSVGFKAPNTFSSSVLWTLPSTDGTSGQVLSTNGSGTLAWTTASSGSSIPSGSMQMYAGSVTQSASSGVVTTNAPSGWLLCNGDIVSRTTYSALFTAIGTTYGAGDGSTTFALPDMRGRVPIGVGQGAGLTNRTLASTTGVESITLSSSNIPSLTTGSESANHTHSGTTGGVSANHYHQNFSDGVNSGSMGRAQYGFSGLGGGYAGVLIVGSGQNNYSTSYTGYISSDHNHTFSTGFASSGHTHTYTNSSPTSINNMQPSISINFIIKI